MARLQRSVLPRRAEPTDASGAGPSDEELLRARVRELEQKLVEKSPGGAATAAAAPAAVDFLPPIQEVEEVNPIVQQAFDAAIASVPRLQKVDDARLGMTGENQYVFSQGNASRQNPIYRRKYEVLGMTMNMQENYMKAFTGAVKEAKASPDVKRMIELQSKGGQGLTKKEVRIEIDKLKKASRLATLFFKDVVPEVLDDPIANTITGLAASAVFVGATLLFCFCLLPPVPPQE